MISRPVSSMAMDLRDNYRAARILRPVSSMRWAKGLRDIYRGARILRPVSSMVWAESLRDIYREAKIGIVWPMVWEKGLPASNLLRETTNNFLRETTNNLPQVDHKVHLARIQPMAQVPNPHHMPMAQAILQSRMHCGPVLKLREMEIGNSMRCREISLGPTLDEVSSHWDLSSSKTAVNLNVYPIYI